MSDAITAFRRGLHPCPYCAGSGIDPQSQSRLYSLGDLTDVTNRITEAMNDPVMAEKVAAVRAEMQSLNDE